MVARPEPQGPQEPPPQPGDPPQGPHGMQPSQTIEPEQQGVKALYCRQQTVIVQELPQQWRCVNRPNGPKRPQQPARAPCGKAAPAPSAASAKRRSFFMAGNVLARARRRPIVLVGAPRPISALTLADD